MLFKAFLFTLLILNTLFLPPAMAESGSGSDGNGNGNSGNGNGNNGNGNGNGGPRQTPGLDSAVLTGLASAGYIGYQLLKARKVSDIKPDFDQSH